MDPLRFFIAIAPLAAYFMLLGVINLRRCPFLTTGARDAAALGVAIAGFVIVGPIELFLPEAAANRFGPYVWVLLLVFYGLCLSLIVLLTRPRIVIYNGSPEQVRPVLASVVAELDKEARWAGDSVTLPTLGIHLHMEALPVLRNVQLVASGPHQSFNGWRKLEFELALALKQSTSSSSPYGLMLVIVAGLVASATAVWMVAQRQDVAQTLSEMLRISETFGQ